MWNWQQSDWPNWRFDDQKLEKLERQFLLGSGQLIGTWQHLSAGHKEQLKVNLLSDEALKTSEIEGEFLDRASVQSSVRRQFGLSADRRSSPAESGIAELMVACFQSHGSPLSHDTLFHWHDLVCRGRRDLNDVAAYRTHDDAMQVVSGRIDDPYIHFEAPPSKDVPEQMDRFLTWLHTSPLPSLTKAGLAHLYFVSVHPFEDGNGRIARAICEHIFANALGQPSLIALSSQIEKERKAYYDALEANNKILDVTPWLIWFGETVLKAQNHSIALINHIIAKTHMMDRLRGQLNPRQEKTLIRMFDAGPEGFTGGLSAANYVSITGATTVTTTRDLNDLVAKSALTKTGQRKSTRYWLKIAQ